MCTVHTDVFYLPYNARIFLFWGDDAIPNGLGAAIEKLLGAGGQNLPKAQNAPLAS